MSAQYGYFVIADMSGYTGYLASVELEHARGVLGEITELLIRELRSPFQFVELEGDAVFVFARSDAIADAEYLIEIIEACYTAFRLLKQQMVSNTSCRCAARHAIKDLNMKCVIHFGAYATQATPTGTKLLGPDVILVHRLLKNNIIERTGIEAYGFVTDVVEQRMKVADLSVSALAHHETYDALGTVGGYVVDLAKAAASRIGHEQYYVDIEDADFVISAEVSAEKSAL